MMVELVCNHASERHILSSKSLWVTVLIAGLIFAQGSAGQERITWAAGTPAGGNSSPLTSAQLQELVGPIALYPDDLIGIILPATTYPIQVVQAVRFLKEHEHDPGLTPDATWDDTIIALLNYPEVLRLLDGNLDWTVKLGEAVINQQQDVMDAIQQFRKRANAAGNLASDDRQIILKNNDTIEIKPADPQVIYIPDYEPERVVVRQYVPVYDYYPFGYPVYYYPYAPDYRFATGFFWGVTTAFITGWNTHHLYSYRHNHHRHPYYGSNFYANRYLYRNRGINHGFDLNHRWNEENTWHRNDYRDSRPAIVTSPTQRRQTGTMRLRADSYQPRSNETGYFENRPGRWIGNTDNWYGSGNRYDRWVRRGNGNNDIDAPRRQGWNRDAMVTHRSQQRADSQAVPRTFRSASEGSSGGSDGSSGPQNQSRLSLQANGNGNYSTNNYYRHRSANGFLPENNQRGRLRR